jgi:hypothetical protein
LLWIPASSTTGPRAAARSSKTREPSYLYNERI